MLEIQVNLKRGHASPYTIGERANTRELVGDIVAVQKHPAPLNWSNKERSEFLICKLDDPVLEASFGDQDILVLPYAKLDSEGSILNASTYRVDINMFDGSSGLDYDNTTHEPVGTSNPVSTHLDKTDLIFDDSDR